MFFFIPLCQYRPYSYSMNLGDTMMGEQLARIVESKNPNFSIGDYITGRFGWRTHTVSDSENKKAGVRKVSPALTQPKSTAIGVLGMPG